MIPTYIAGAIKDILLGDEPLSAVESYVLFGAPNLADRIRRLRKQGFIFDCESVPLETVYQRLDMVLQTKMPRPRYVGHDEVTITQWRRNKAKEKTNALVLAPDENAARLEKRRPVRPVRH